MGLAANQALFASTVKHNRSRRLLGEVIGVMKSPLAIYFRPCPTAALVTDARINGTSLSFH
jgi:hypothetical protein